MLARIAERMKQCFEYCGSRSFFPLAIDRCFFGGRNLPVGLKAAEMVDANDVAKAKGCAHSFDPPAIAFLRMGWPVIERVSPVLPGGAEVIWRDARYNAWVAFFVQIEQSLICPDISAVG